jgi:hypothetical protein
LKQTSETITAQIQAMGSDFFEVGLFNPSATNEPFMILRSWDAATVIRSVSWLKYENWNGRNIFIRPKGEHDLSLVDDLKARSVESMKGAGFAPAAVVETSPGNFQAWLKHHTPLTKQMSTAAARELARRFGGDLGAADWRHFGRLAGLTNRKEKYKDAESGLYPFVLLREASGAAYPEAPGFLAGVESIIRRQQEDEARRGAMFKGRAPAETTLKSIEEFRSDPRYGGDGTRIDLAYAIYALSHGMGMDQVGAVLRMRDLAHKGNERRQSDYIERTTRKALDAVQGIGRGR